MNPLEFPGTTKTLRQRLNEGRIPVQDGLRYAALLAEALRKMHDEGRAHGFIAPDSIALTATGIDLLPAFPGRFSITPYTAPEVAGEHKPADARSDIFSFGAVVFETLTGRKAFDGETEQALSASLCFSPAPPSGSPAVDRLLVGCLAKDPAARWQRIQKIQLELKLLTAAARRAVAPVSAPRAGGGLSETAIRAELALFEARVTAKLQAQQQDVANIQRTANEAVNNLRGQLASLGGQLAVAQEQVGRGGGTPDSALRVEMAQLEARLTARLQTQELDVANIQRAAGETVHSLRGQLAALGGQLRAAQEQMISGGGGGGGDSAVAMEVADRLGARVQRSIDSLNERMALLEQHPGAPTGDFTRQEAGLQSVREQLHELHTLFAADMHEFELNLKAQSNAIDSARTAMAQTDDLVERVVEALESLQATVLEQSEERAMAIN